MKQSIALAALVLTLAVSACAVAATPGGDPASPSTAASPKISAGPSGIPPATPPAPSPSAPASPSGTASPSSTGPVACAMASLEARITRWEGAAGSWIVHVEVRNARGAGCLLPAVVRPLLVDAKGSVLIEPGSTAPSRSPSGTSVPPPAAERPLAAGATATTEIRVGNYCGPAPATPLAMALVFPGGARLGVSPLGPTDDTIPDCMSTPGSPGSIEIQPWGQ